MPKKLLSDLRALIQKTRQDVARTVNSALVQMYWQVGTRIREDVLKAKRAEYGEAIVSALMTQLGWTHFLHIIPLDDPLKRDSYAEMCRMALKFQNRRCRRFWAGRNTSRSWASTTTSPAGNRNVARQRRVRCPYPGVI